MKGREQKIGKSLSLWCTPGTCEKREGKEYKLGRGSEESVNHSCPFGVPHPTVELLLCSVFGWRGKCGLNTNGMVDTERWKLGLLVSYIPEGRLNGAVTWQHILLSF